VAQQARQGLDAARDDSASVNWLSLLTALAQGGEEGTQQVLELGCMQVGGGRIRAAGLSS
jgi:hypothetical protein